MKYWALVPALLLLSIVAAEVVVTELHQQQDEDHALNLRGAKLTNDNLKAISPTASLVLEEKDESDIVELDATATNAVAPLKKKKKGRKKKRSKNRQKKPKKKKKKKKNNKKGKGKGKKKKKKKKKRRLSFKTSATSITGVDAYHDHGQAHTQLFHIKEDSVGPVPVVVPFSDASSDASSDRSFRRADTDAIDSASRIPDVAVADLPSAALDSSVVDHSTVDAAVDATVDSTASALAAV